MNNNLNTFINEIYKLKSLHRYNNKPKIIVENVAEHLYFTSIIVLKLSEIYTFDVFKALQMALIHDLGEIYTGDITHDIKDKYPELKSIIYKAESEAINENFGNVYAKLFEELEVNHESVESMIVEMADVLSVIQYTNQEITLGNKGYMQKVYDYSIDRVDKLENKLITLKKNRN